MMSSEELMTLIKHRAIEKVVYTRNENAFKIRMEELPPIISHAIQNENVVNTEYAKQSAFLKSGDYAGKSCVLREQSRGCFPVTRFSHVRTRT